MVARMSELKLSTLAEIAGLGVMADILKNVAIQAMGTASTYTTLSKEFGINTDLLQRWQNVAIKSNVPIEAVASSFAKVQQTLAGFKQGKIDTAFLQGGAFLNIPNVATMTYDKIFETLQQKVPEVIRRRGRAFTTNALQMMGIDPAMIQELELNRRTFAARERGPIMSDAEIRKWTDLNNQIKTLSHNLQILGQHLEAYFIGPLNKIVGEALRLTEGGKLNKGENAALTGAALVSGTVPSATVAQPILLDAILSALEKMGIVQNVTTKTDIHVHGDNAEIVGKETARHLERQQRALTTAMQTANSQQAY